MNAAVEKLGRAGLVAKGIPYLVIGFLALEVAFPGKHGKEADRTGALRAVANHPYGKVALVALAIGFGAYALWRFAQAFLDRDGEGGDASGLAKRAAFLARGLLYVGFAYTTVEVLSGSGGSSNQKQQTRSAFDLPLGRELVFAAGAGFLVAGGWNWYRGVSRNFMKDMQVSGDAKRVVTPIGVVGHVARGIVWAIVGWFLVKAAWEYDSKKAVGLDGALAKLGHSAYGPFVLGVVAAGLFAYGLFCFTQARYRDV